MINKNMFQVLKNKIATHQWNEPKLNSFQKDKFFKYIVIRELLQIFNHT